MDRGAVVKAFHHAGNQQGGRYQESMMTSEDLRPGSGTLHTTQGRHQRDQVFRIALTFEERVSRAVRGRAEPDGNTEPRRRGHAGNTATEQRRLPQTEHPKHYARMREKRPHAPRQTDMRGQKKGGCKEINKRHQPRKKKRDKRPQVSITKPSDASAPLSIPHPPRPTPEHAVPPRPGSPGIP